MKEYNFREEVNKVVNNVLLANRVDRSLKSALEKFSYPSGKLIVLAIGKAAYEMARVAEEALGEAIDEGMLITKYDHSKGTLKHCKVFEAAHPVPDENSFKATKEAIKMCESLSEKDKVLFLISGGGSALFELPLINVERLYEITDVLLKNGADITEINTLRKHISAVKGGRFARICEPAQVESIVLSDVIGDDLSAIASGPAYPDSTSLEDALIVAEKYGINFTEEEIDKISEETPKELSNVKTSIIGNVSKLCESAIKEVEQLGYKSVFLTDRLSCEAKEIGTFLANIAQTYRNTRQDIAFICGGETVVHVKGDGKGGRNQEIVLSAAIGIKDLSNMAIFSIGSDGTDGPTDAAGGFADGDTYRKILRDGKKPENYLENNDAYNALALAEGLIKTGSTGTNVNDISILLIKSGR